ncbi:hypothetical protein [uncultured Paludibaculum sp.]|uniref:hypothetical protein n=1 Tax=uncultured Paludibaculum sp. TaxID=1765020 RepID=UPI002AABCED7|nr:hypothetical protein [uncultured Paludibaculum sp.]
MTRRLDDLLTAVLLCAVSLALIVMIGVETTTHWTSLRSGDLILKDVAASLGTGLKDGKPVLSEAAYKYLLDLSAAQRGIRDAGGLAFMYNLSVLGIVLVSGMYYKKARRELHDARRLVTDRQRAGDLSGEMHMMALDISVAQGLAIVLQCGSHKEWPTVAPVLRECLNEIHIGLVALDHNGGWIAPALYDRIKVGVRRINTSLSQTCGASGRGELADILAKTREVLTLLHSKEFAARCRKATVTNGNDSE